MTKRLGWRRASRIGIFGVVSLLAGCAAPGRDPPAVAAQPSTPPSSRKAGAVTVMCYVEVTGVPDHCKIMGNTGDPALAVKTLAWLQGPNPPHYKPERQDGANVAAWHKWVITFRPPA